MQSVEVGSFGQSENVVNSDDNDVINNDATDKPICESFPLLSQESQQMGANAEMHSVGLCFSSPFQSENFVVPDGIDVINEDRTNGKTGENGLPSTAIYSLSDLDIAFQILDKNVRKNVMGFNTHVFCLPFEECDKIDHAVSTSSGQIRAGFAKWKEVNGKEATVELLIRMLRSHDRNDIADKMTEELGIVYNTGFLDVKLLNKAFQIFERAIKDKKHAVRFFRVQLQLNEREISDSQKRDTTHLVLQCLNIWKEKQGNNATVGHFMKLLKNASLTYIAEEISREVQVSSNEGEPKDAVNTIIQSPDIGSSHRQSTEIAGDDDMPSSHRGNIIPEIKDKNSEDALGTRPKFQVLSSTRQSQSVTADVAKIPLFNSGVIKSGKGGMCKGSYRGNTIAESKSYDRSSSAREAQNVTEEFGAKLPSFNSGDIKPITKDSYTEDKKIEYKEIDFIDESGTGKRSRSASGFTHSTSMNGKEPRKKQNKSIQAALLITNHGNNSSDSGIQTGTFSIHEDGDASNKANPSENDCTQESGSAETVPKSHDRDATNSQETRPKVIDDDIPSSTAHSDMRVEFRKDSNRIKIEGLGIEPDENREYTVKSTDDDKVYGDVDNNEDDPNGTFVVLDK
ncbi:uncharacterized protein LOC120343837 [Styela clava]